MATLTIPQTTIRSADQGLPLPNAKLKALCRIFDLTAYRLAKIMGIPPSRAYGYFREISVSPPPAKLLPVLAYARERGLDIHLEWFYTDEPAEVTVTIGGSGD